MEPTQEQPACLIQIALFADGRVQVGGTLPQSALVLRGLLDHAKENLLALWQRQAAGGGRIEVAPPGLAARLNGKH